MRGCQFQDCVTVGFKSLITFLRCLETICRSCPENKLRMDVSTYVCGELMTMSGSFEKGTDCGQLGGTLPFRCLQIVYINVFGCEDWPPLWCGDVVFFFKVLLILSFPVWIFRQFIQRKGKLMTVNGFYRIHKNNWSFSYALLFLKICNAVNYLAEGVNWFVSVFFRPKELKGRITFDIFTYLSASNCNEKVLNWSFF